MSIQGTMMNLIFKAMGSGSSDQPHDYAKEREVNSARKPAKISAGNRLEEILLNGIHGERITPEERNPLVIWYIHGGGFTTGSAMERRSVTDYLAKTFHAVVYANNYRLSPENIWPAHLEDCMAFFRGMLSEGIDPERLIIMGESAGGTLSLSVGLRIRDEGLPLPMGIGAYSPCTNQAQILPSHRDNAKTDYMLGDSINSQEQYLAVFGSDYKNAVDLRNPYISPYFGNYRGLPPIFLSASDSETLLDDSKYLYKKLKAEGHPVFIDIKHNQCHAYPMFPMIPEGRDTLAKAMNFLNREE